MNIHDSQDSRGRALSLTPLYHLHPLHTLRHKPGDQRAPLCTYLAAGLELGEPSVSQRKSLTTKLRALNLIISSESAQF